MRIKIEWPWQKQKRQIEALKREVENIQKALVKARVANFIFVKTYRIGDPMADQVIEPISLEKLRDDVDVLLKNRYRQNQSRHNAQAQLPSEQAKPAEGTRSAAALRAVNCSDLLAFIICQISSND